MFDDIIEQAIKIFHKEKSDFPKLGDIIAHLSDEYTYEVRSMNEGNKLTCFYIDKNRQEVVKEFPTDEVFDPNLVKKIALKLI